MYERDLNLRVERHFCGGCGPVHRELKAKEKSMADVSNCISRILFLFVSMQRNFVLKMKETRCMFLESAKSPVERNL